MRGSILAQEAITIQLVLVIQENRRPMFCTHCQMQGHLKENCYKLNGYPLGHRLHKDKISQNYKGHKSVDNNVSYSAGNINNTKNEKILPAGMTCGTGNTNSPPPSQLSQVQMGQLTKVLSMFNQRETRNNGQFHMADSLMKCSCPMAV
ncbi:hypothetical protein QQ045_009612 [Rhodiola kirilowii]